MGSVAPRTGVAEPLRRPTASRGRKRPRAAARLVGTSRAACCRSRLRVNPFLFWFVSLWLLFSGVWETLIFGTGDWFAFGEPFFCGLFTPTYPLPGHRLVPESQLLICLNLWHRSQIAAQDSTTTCTEIKASILTCSWLIMRFNRCNRWCEAP